MSKKTPIFSSQAGYELAAPGYDKKEKYLDSFEKGRLLPLLGDLAGKIVLDVGAGTGRLVGRLSRCGAMVTALDISPGMLKVLAKKDKYVKLVMGDAENLPFENYSFVWVVAAFLIVHLADPSRFFDEAYRVLKDGGRLLLTNINQKEPPAVETAEGDIKIQSYYHRPERIREILRGLAFEIEKEEIVEEKGVWINQIIVAKK